jgi:enamine deaminase RidA (YjgF/YER057c/UK114 family)
MYCLNGDRIYIKPSDGSSSLEHQVSDCLSQLKKINSGKKIFKLNFFADTASDKAYVQLKTRLQQLVRENFQTPVICGLIAQPPLTCRILVEAFYFDAKLWDQVYIPGDEGSAIHFKRGNAEMLIGHVQACHYGGCRGNAEKAFASFDHLLKQTGLSLRSVIRQWNYIQNILGFESDNQCYQEFNNVRTKFYAGHFLQNGYPAATGIGTNRGGVIVEFVALNAPGAISLPLDNPRQVAAHDYSETVLIGDARSTRSTPKFERARYLELFGKKQVFISGTASIVGEKTTGTGDPEKQTETTIQNMQQLYSQEVLSAITGNSLRPVYGHARVYVKNRKDFPRIKKVFKKYYGNLPVVYILADICREELLVEIEGKVILR